MGCSLKQGSGPRSYSNKVGHNGMSTYKTLPNLIPPFQQRISILPKGEGCSRGGSSEIASDAASPSTDR